MARSDPLADDLARLQRDTFQYFLEHVNPANGLVLDSTREGAPASIAAVGFALAAYAVGVERGFLPRREAIQRTLATLRFFREAPQGTHSDAIGQRGFFYHFLDFETGRRAQRSEVSTIDTSILLAGALACAGYFDGDGADEAAIRTIAEELYSRADWRWASNGGPTVAHGWKPEKGFLRYRWEGYNESLLLYVLALGSPSHPLPEAGYRAATQSYRWKKLYGLEHLYAGPLFIHQLSHVWLDLRGIQDASMRGRGIDYFENSRRATYVHQRYAIRNPRRFRGYNENCWGITASDGPGPRTLRVDGVKRTFWDYRARGVPFGPDDGTLAPWAVVASLPFAPEIVLPTLRHINDGYPGMMSEYGFKCSFNPTFQEKSGDDGWHSQGYYGLDQGPVVLMIENYDSGLLWRLSRENPHIERGLRRAGFRGGWLA